MGIGYFTFVYVLFSQYHLWLPWFTPLVLQTPIALVLGLTWHYRRTYHSREHLRRLFGYYLPGEVIDRLIHDERHPIDQSVFAYGVCLATDAANYTALAETMNPKELQEYLNRYFEILFAPIRLRDGVVSDVVGDAMLAIWPATCLDPTLPQKACEAALEIDRMIKTSKLEPKLVTRMGLHSGELVMSHVGAIDHFEYRAVGDIVNTASRIENLNKKLGTRILATQDFVRNLQGIITRDLGHFYVAGKSLPIPIYEIVAKAETADDTILALHKAFAAALSQWQDGDKKSAQRIFQEIIRQYPDDGPSHYYLQQFWERRSTQRNVL
jgi:adenylate cyclase